jgi:Ca-activated chloride channel family protein
MKSAMTFVVALLAGVSIATANDHGKGITIDGRLNCPYISHNGGTVYLQISITAPAIETPHRRPMNLSVVLDRSGSMADDGKIEYAKRALFTLIDQLQPDDIFSLVIYDDVIEVLRHAHRVRDKRELRHLVDEVYPRGATNLGGGIMEGLRQVERNLDKEYVNRVILLSDGLANRGITDRHELERVARRYRAKSISLTTMGVGLDYNENLMVGLAESGGGNYYFIESPQGLASIFHREFNMLSSVVAQNARIELTLGRGVRLTDAIGCEHRNDKDEYVIPIGDLYSGERRELTVELEVLEGTGTLTVAKGVLKYDGKRGWFESWPSFSAAVRYTRLLAEVDKNRDLEAQAKVDIALTTRRVDKAMKALDEGRQEEAAKELKAAEASLVASPAVSVGGTAGAALQDQRAKLQSYQNILKDTSDSRKAKKSIQFDNYQTQKRR